MKIAHLVLIESIAGKAAQDPALAKMLALSWKHDRSLPVATQVQLGPNPTNQQIVDKWSSMVDQVMQDHGDYADISRDTSSHNWLIKSYARGNINWEDLSGEAIDRLGKFKALSVRSLLKPEHTDLNRFVTLNQLNAMLASYDKVLRTIEQQSRLEQMKRQAASIVLIDNDRYHVSIPLNYGACYMFNTQDGVRATFCTGSSSGRHWFERYSQEGPMIDVLDKYKSDTVMGKWQLHAATDQIKNANQTVNSDREFAKRFPGLLKQIAKEMISRSAEIDSANPKWNAAKEAAKLLATFPLSAADAPPDKPKRSGTRSSRATAN